MPIMRAKMQVAAVVKTETSELLRFSAVCKSDGYPADGSDDDNTFARWSPQADLSLTVCNPALFGQFEVGQKYYVDFTAAE